MATKKTAAQAAGKKEARPAAAPGSEKSEAMAKMALRPSVNAAAVMVSYGKPLGIAEDDIAALMDRLGEDVQDVWAGDMKRAEAMLFGQAHALQAIFMNDKFTITNNVMWIFEFRNFIFIVREITN